jgi:hypothetical protein
VRAPGVADEASGGERGSTGSLMAGYLIRKSSRGRAQAKPSGAERAVPEVYGVLGCG